MNRLFITALAVAGFTLVGTVSVKAHCGSCGEEAKHDHKHDHGMKPYVKGETKCCSAEHYTKMQKKKIAEEAKAAYKEGDCCSADHYAGKKVKAAELAAYKSEYKKGETECCSADHYAKKKMKAKHGHKHAHGLKPYVKGETECCSAEHYTETQKKKIAEGAKAAYKEGDCCSADHYASKKVKAAELTAYKSEYKKGETECCSAEHYAKTKMSAAKKEK